MSSNLRAWAEIDLAAIAHNTRMMAAAAPAAKLCAVVKADGYGHGAVEVAQTALASGATWLAVAQGGEAAPLRAAGLDAPILVLSEPAPGELRTIFEGELRVVLSTSEGVEALGRAAAARGRTVPVHLKVDTGMHRAGCAPADAVALAVAISRHPRLALEGVMTHCAVADEPGHPATDEQLGRFADVLALLEAAGVRPAMAHAANSAAALTRPDSHFDLVRAGITLYGLTPSPALAPLPAVASLRPALSLHARVALVRRVGRDEGVSYGLRHRFAADTTVATLPIGYADGVRRPLGLAGTAVLVGGRRCPMVGVVTMDQLVVDCAAFDEVAIGDDAVLIGRQGEEAVSADDWAAALGTINYEVVTGLRGRVPRTYLPVVRARR